MRMRRRPKNPPLRKKGGFFVLGAFLHLVSLLKAGIPSPNPYTSNILDKNGKNTGEGLNFFWVNIGLSHKEAVDGNFLWAPLHSQKEEADGVIRTTRFGHWDVVGTVRAGDVIFCNVERRITYIAVAKSDAYEADQPATRVFKGWDAKGRRIDVQLFKLEPAISIEGHLLETFAERYNDRCTPRIVTKIGSIFQGYMASLPTDAGIDLLHLAGDQEESVANASIDFHSPAFSKTRPPSPTTKQALREARIGQGRFRKDLLNLWRVCPITGVTHQDLLIASHVKPWAISSDEEKLDPFNGFLFAAHIDRLFDKGLISFSTNGNILISPHLSVQDTRALNIDRHITLPLKPGNQKYLKEHRRIFGWDE